MPSRSRLMPTIASILPSADAIQDFRPLVGVESVVQPAAADALFRQVSRHFFGALLGQRRHQHALPNRDPFANLAQEMLHLAVAGHDLDLRVQQAGRADHLRDDRAAGLCQFVGAGRRRDVDHLADLRFPLLERQRPAVHRAGQAKAVLDQILHPLPAARVHTARSAGSSHGDSSRNARKSSGK